ncbi:glycosyltransferase family 25 protein [Burkholderia pseudomallei]|uniref:glycosyltransferase family 25 protein n=1 Tax=Burkholderia pseudomallei TaxID=28450 RepID=UPI001AD7143F|nr:glycosyltransferase family 25 protein [Burkholderia pseudomallei]MBO7930939.1 glycosyltransferase family 25 protein [Burkholderia pseudomallei]
MKYVCISLKRAKNRREGMARQFKEHGIGGQFFDAIDIDGDVDNVPGYNARARKFLYGAGLTKGQVGCYLSHREVWRQLVESGDEAWCVMEDDIRFEPGFKDAVEELYSFREQWDVVRLYGIFDNPKIEYASLPSRIKLMWMDVHPLGMQCYVITRNAAKRLLETTEKIRVPIDDALDENWKHRLRLYLTSPEFVSDRNIQSTIGKLDSTQTIGYRIFVKPFRRLRKLPRMLFNARKRPTAPIKLSHGQDTHQVQSSAVQPMSNTEVVQ